jgi:hypothetical protein
MERLLICLFLAAFVDLVNAQMKSPSNQEKLEHDLVVANKVKYAGLILTLTGTAAIICGDIMAKNGLGIHYPNTPGHITNDTYSTIGGVSGLCLVIVGIPIICIGVATLAFGLYQHQKAKTHLQISLASIKSPYSKASINGIGLTIRF